MTIEEQMETLAMDAAKNAKFQPPEKLLTPDDVAQWLGVSVAFIRDHATRKEPRIPVVRFGKLMRFRASDVEAFIEKWRRE